ncbi:Trp biosynthesis-associated membrane protein [Nocardioides sp. CER19]|uniref:Trp biosynthesis-associated membrane protein n=1 Tax=Nocardioides sp. CER19 TaxID=3038538 RepID=UPI002449A8A3|nr:Trp biosynthesis-associated membrane protein [Nocardioides sp. CER19]MDH2416661.1 Trp biosynthesis-associated membrane protein [Nocardioides sp. CER19]
MRSFWPTVLLGVAGAGVAAYAGAQDWVHIEAGGDPITAVGVSLDSPSTTSLALVALAAWGVFLVTRGMFRRVVAGIAAFASIAPVPGVWSTRHHLLHTHTDSVGTAWPWVAVVGCVVACAAAVVAVVKAPGWPEMGRRYDAPAGAETRAVPLEEQSSIDVWKALDQGQDPTARQTPERPE